MHLKLTLFVLGAALFTLLACGNDADSAGAAAKRNFEYLDKGQFSKMYDDLLPAQQAVVSREVFTRCYAESGGSSFDNVKVLESYPERVAVPGVSGEMDTTAVTVEFTTGGRKDRSTGHQILVDGKWKWFLKAFIYDAMKAGKCPS